VSGVLADGVAVSGFTVDYGPPARLTFDDYQDEVEVIYTAGFASGVCPQSYVLAVCAVATALYDGQALPDLTWLQGSRVYV